MATQQVKSMVSETSICNQALSWLGANRITTLEDNSTEAEHCRDNYPFLRDAVLEARMWKFAAARKKSTVADLTDWGNLYKHPLPLDWMQVFYVWADPDDEDQTDWDKEGAYVIAPETTIYMKGNLRVTDTGKMSALFTQAVAARLAADLCIPLTGKRDLQRDMWALYLDKLDEAATRDGQQGRNKKIRSKTLTRVRVGGRGDPTQSFG